MSKRTSLLGQLKDKVFRSHFVSAQVRRLVTTQIRKLRESRNLTQGELGKLAGMKPNAISRLENPDYGDFTVNTLLRIAAAFDVGLIVRFAPFSELIASNEEAKSGRFVPAAFNQEHLFSPVPDAFFYRPVTQSVRTISTIDQNFLQPPLTEISVFQFSEQGTIEQPYATIN